MQPKRRRAVCLLTMTAAVERALIRRILQGERQAAEELIRAHQPSLYAYLLRLTQRPERAEDVRTFANTLQIRSNVIAIEVHQTSRSSSDLAMRFRLVGTRR